MPNWQDMSPDEMLNDLSEVAGQLRIARFDRILQHRSTLAVVDLTKTIHRVGQLAQENIERLRSDYQKAAQGQEKQQKTLVWLTAVIAAATIAYTVVTWESVAAMREGNAIQQRLLEAQKPRA
jgi:hypothetical protein